MHQHGDPALPRSAGGWSGSVGFAGAGGDPGAPRELPGGGGLGPQWGVQPDRGGRPGVDPATAVRIWAHLTFSNFDVLL
jgi:hypothetical protein